MVAVKGPGLAVKGQVVNILAHQYMGQKAGLCDSLFNGAMWQCCHKYALPVPFGIFGAYGTALDQTGGGILQGLGDLLTNFCSPVVSSSGSIITSRTGRWSGKRLRPGWSFLFLRL